MKESTINLTSNEKLPSVGTVLKETREKRKLSIEQVAAKLFSDPDIVEDLENDISICEEKLREGNINFHTHSDLELYLTFHSIIETRPNLGIGAILDLLC